MAELIRALGIDWKLLLASIINFFLLFVILRRYAYRPILRMLERREKLIAENVQKGKELDERLAEVERQRQRERRAAQAEAGRILSQATQEAEALKAEVLAAARREAETIYVKTKHELALERERLRQSVKKEVADLVLLAAGKVLEQRLSAAADRRLVERTMEDLERLPK